MITQKPVCITLFRDFMPSRITQAPSNVSLLLPRMLRIVCYGPAARLQMNTNAALLSELHFLEHFNHRPWGRGDRGGCERSQLPANTLSCK